MTHKTCVDMWEFSFRLLTCGIVHTSAADMWDDDKGTVDMWDDDKGTVDMWDDEKGTVDMWDDDKGTVDMWECHSKGLLACGSFT